MNYFELTLELRELEPWREIFIAELAEQGFESFVETNSGFLAYIPENLLQENMLSAILSHDQILSSKQVWIEDQNWNAEWEKNFDPVFVEDKLAIVAPFHTVPDSYKQVITIMPKMSFGTGHHQTTWLMSKAMFDLDLTDKHVLDMGTGTGILAILAEKLGAAKIYAPDIDTWSFENAQENCAMNSCSRIEVALGSTELLNEKIFHIIIANINKNVLTQHFSVYSKSLVPGGKLLISGFFETDKDDLIKEAQKHGFVFEKIDSREGWALIHLTKLS